MSSAASEPSRLPARFVAAFRDHERGRNLHIKTPQSDPSLTTAEGALIDISSSANDPSTPDMFSPIQSPVSHTSAVANGWSPGSHIITGRVLKGAARGVLELDAIPQADLLKIMAMLLEQIAASNDALRESSVAVEAGPALTNLRAAQPNGLEKNTRSDDGGRAPSPTSSVGTPASSTSGSSGHKSPTQRTRPVSSTPVWDHLTSASRVALSSRTAALSFHARHIPQISLESYLLRILKYCPTSNTTFVAVLVYFDRMCKIAASIEAEKALMVERPTSPNPDGGVLHSPRRRNAEGHVKTPPNSQPQGFTIDSYNIHRLVIAGVTVASKFFSDVFYTNSRYAKVSQRSSQSTKCTQVIWPTTFRLGVCLYLS